MHPDGTHRRTGFGLTIQSDRAIAGTFEDPGGSHRPPDIVVETLPSLASESVTEPVYRWDGETLIFSAPGVARYFCRSTGIAVAAERDADPDWVADLLVATALPAVLWLRGDAVLHAAAVVSPAGSVLAIAGPSGIGKSTVARQLIAMGGRLLADDTIRLFRDGDTVRGAGLAAGYHLARRDGEARTFHPVAGRSSATSLAMGTIAFLSRTSGEPTLGRLDARGALEKLLAHQHRPAIPALLGRRAETLTLLSRVARCYEIYDWRRSSAEIDPAEHAMLARAGVTGWGNE